MKSGIRILAAAVLTLAACSGGGAGDTSPSGAVLTSVQVSAPAQTVVIGQTLQLSATARDQNGNPISATIEWSSSAATIASVNGGLVTGVSTGIVTITARATAGGRTVPGTITLTVTALPLASVVISAPANAVLLGGTLQLTASPRNQNGGAVAAAVSFSSSAIGIASVTTTGLVSGNAIGTATITATATAGTVTVSADFVITVSALPPALTTVTITAPTTTILIGASVQATATPKDQYGNAYAAVVDWGSSANGVATVTGTGLVTGVAAGSATITATATDGAAMAFANVVITVTAPPTLTSVAVTPAAPSVVAGATVQLSAQPLDQNLNPIAAAVTWETSDATKATVTGNGLVSGIAAGTATITATATSGAITVMSGVTVTVTAAPTFPLTADVTATSSNVFSPGSVDIQRTGTVRWMFAALHNVTFGGGAGAPANIPNTGSGTVSRQFNTVGTFSYQCTLHPGMSGAVIVH